MDKRKDKDGLTEAEFLEKYQPGDYIRPSVATDMVIFMVTEKEQDNYRKLPEKELRVLLIQRGVHPYLGQWALPGGFVRPTETTEQAAVRELREETGVDNVYLEQLYTFSDIGRDPRTWVMSCSYMALIDSAKAPITAGDDADNAAWFHLELELLEEKTVICESMVTKKEKLGLKLINEDTILSAVLEKAMTRVNHEQRKEYRILENNGIALDHVKIITYAIERLRGKLEYTDLALHLMPELFTLTELQQVYEVIMNKNLLKAAFRRKVAKLVEESDYFTENEGHRPSRLYRKKLKEEEG